MHPAQNDKSLDERAEQLLLDTMMSGRRAVGNVADRRLFRHMVIRNLVSAIAPHVILAAGLSLMSESVRPYPIEKGKS